MLLAKTPAFTWSVPRNRKGFCLLGKDETHPYRVAEVEGNAFDFYAPFQEQSGLFLTLAYLPPKAESALDFANQYGFLRRQMDAVPGPESFEPVHSWLQEIAWLRASVDLWENARTGNLSALGASISWLDDGRRLRFRPSPKQAAQEWDSGDAVELHGLDSDDLVSAAYFVLHARINARLTQDEKPTVELEWDGLARRSSLVVSPGNLLQVMLLQLSAAVAEDKQFRACRECGRWFELIPGARQEYRLTCSAACRVRSYRARMAAARAMESDGKTPREIAKELEASVETVRKWLQLKG